MNAIDAAREMLGTPYHGGASTPGLGCDCAGLIEYVAARVRGVPAPPRGPITPDYYDDPADPMLTRIRQHLQPIERCELGAVLVFRIRNRAACSHVSICTEMKDGHPYRHIHAHSWARAHGTVESTLGPKWQARVVAMFRI